MDLRRVAVGDLLADPAQRVKQVCELSRFMSRVAEAVDYIVIGGVAVGFHGYVRATEDRSSAAR